MLFSTIPGYIETKKQLLRTVENQRIPHAQLWIGPEGSPNLTLALAFATYLNCTRPHAEDACSQCPSCLQMHKLIHPDVTFIFPATQLRTHDVPSTHLLPPWRTFLQTHPYGTIRDWAAHIESEYKSCSITKEEVKKIIQHISLKSFAGGYKIIFLWLPEYLHPAAASALLKTLEEPPPYTIFLLVSCQPEKLLPTLRSRTQPLYLTAFTDQAIAQLLTQQHTVPAKKLAEIILLANGNFNTALMLLQTTQQADNFEQFTTWMRRCYTQDFTQLVNQATHFYSQTKEIQKNRLAYALHLLRAALVSRFVSNQLAKLTEAEQTFVQRLGKTLFPKQIQCFTTWINQAYYAIERNAHPKLVYLDISLKMSSSFSQTGEASHYATTYPSCQTVTAAQ